MKRALDVVLAAIGLVVGSPVLLGQWRRSGSRAPGTPIYRQRRVGRGGRKFDLYKLRTMVHGAEHVGAGMAVNEGDPRITRVGAFLRRTSLDELPNLVNVLRGEMSIVGPRPTIPVQVEQYTERGGDGWRSSPGSPGPDQRAGVAAVVGAHRARPLVRRAPVAGARPADPRPYAGPARAGEAVQGETGGWRK